MKNANTEDEDLYGEFGQAPIIKPYNPLDVDIIPQQIVLRNIFDRLEHKEIILDPDFQRNPQLWDPKRQSRLIESLLIRIPLPMFYFDSSEEEIWTVVDGLQRVTALNNFVVRKNGDPLKLKLEGLEYLSSEFEGKTFEDLPRVLQRRLQEQVIFAYIIRPGTPDKVKTSIFERINTGGLSLNAAEIRNSVYRGQAADSIKRMALSDSFVRATQGKISPKRMLDREFTARFAIFYLLGPSKYNGNMEDFFDDGMSYLRSVSNSTVTQMEMDFDKSMQLSHHIFGKYAFRKNIKGESMRFGPINRAIFECVSVCFAKLSPQEYKLIYKKNKDFFDGYINLFKGPFYEGINNATGTADHVKVRYTELNNYIKQFVENQ